MAYGFRHIPKDRKQTEKLRPFDQTPRPLWSAMPIIHFEPFQLEPENKGELQCQ